MFPTQCPLLRPPASPVAWPLGAVRPGSIVFAWPPFPSASVPPQLSPGMRPAEGQSHHPHLVSVSPMNATQLSTCFGEGKNGIRFGREAQGPTVATREVAVGVPGPWGSYCCHPRSTQGRAAPEAGRGEVTGRLPASGQFQPLPVWAVTAYAGQWPRSMPHPLPPPPGLSRTIPSLLHSEQ